MNYKYIIYILALLIILSILGYYYKAKDEFDFVENFDIVSGCLILKEPFGETHLQKYNLFKNKHSSKLTQNIITLLSYSDGNTTIIEIANKFNIDSFEIVEAVKILLEKNVVKLKHI